MTLSSTIRGDVEVDEGVDEGKYECDDDPCNGGTYGDGPNISPIEAAGDLLLPLLFNGDESQKAFVSGELKRDLLKGYQRPRNGTSTFVLDTSGPAINESSVQGGEGEGVGGQCRGSQANGNWSCVGVCSDERLNG